MDPLAAIISLLRPQAIGTKLIHGAGRWGVRYPEHGQPSFALVLKGSCSLAVEGRDPMLLETGDFILFPAMPGFTLASDPKVQPRSMRLPRGEHPVEEVFHGDRDLPPSVILLGGYFAFDPVNAPILLDLLPAMVRLRASERGNVAAIVELLQRESREHQAGRTLVLVRLVEILLVEALRSVEASPAAAGVLAGLRDPRLGAALRCIHTQTAEPWTLATLAREAGMSRSAFAERFARVMGVTPLHYLLRWRIAVAKNLMIHEHKTVAETALAVGYESASGFSTAFSRETGQAPRDFAAAPKGLEPLTTAKTIAS